MSEQRALTWSGKWHIIEPGHPEARRYAVARCGASLYRDDDPHYPQHLALIKAGTKKSTGDCKLCNRSAGIRTATVNLPAPDEVVPASGDTHGVRQWWVPGGCVVVFDSGTVEYDLGDHHGADVTGVKAIAAALLAAADAAEAAK